MALGASGETGGGLDGAGSADGQEDATVIECRKDAAEFIRSLAEPANMGTDFTAAGAARDFARRFVQGGVVKRRTVTGIATAFEEFTVHVNDAPGASLLVEIVDILSAQEEAIG